MALLKLEDCTVYYRKALAIENISIEIGAQELVSILGSNGAGKSTILKLITGMVKQTSGRVLFDGEVVSGMPPHKIVGKGISLCPEAGRLAGEMTVIENLELGAYLQRDKARIRMQLEEIYDLFPVLRTRRRQLAGTLSGGERQMVAIGRSLMSTPRLLLLDEPSLGLSPLLKKQIFHQIAKIKEMKKACVLVEQEAAFGLSISMRSYVIASGRIVLEGRSKDVAKDETVRRTYLGMA